jgi:hypothetical protein
MKIEYERGGGIIGSTTGVNIDTDKLSSNEKQEVEKIIKESNFFSLPSNMSPENGAADYTGYRITVHLEEKEKTIEASGHTMPQSLLPLIRYLEDKASQQK